MSFVSSNIVAWDRVTDSSSGVIAGPYLIPVASETHKLENDETYFVGEDEIGDGRHLQWSVLFDEKLSQRCWGPHGWEAYGSGDLAMDLGNYAPTPGSFDVDDLISGGPFTTTWELAELAETGNSMAWPDFTLRKNKRPLWIQSSGLDVDEVPIAEYHRTGWGISSGKYVPIEDTDSGARNALLVVCKVTFTVRVLTPFIYRLDDTCYCACDLSVGFEAHLTADEAPPYNEYIFGEFEEVFEGSNWSVAANGSSLVSYNPDLLGIPAGTAQLRDEVISPIETYGTLVLYDVFSVNGATADITLQINQYYTGEPVPGI